MSRVYSMIGCLFVLTVLLVGCSEPTKTAKAPDKKKDEKKEEKPHDHSGWWCGEHGIPEEECSQCLPPEVVKTKFKDKGDWCEIHKDRAKSQCFKCDPALYEKVFEPKYVAKFGKKPERPPQEEFEK